MYFVKALSHKPLRGYVLRYDPAAQSLARPAGRSRRSAGGMRPTSGPAESRGVGGPGSGGVRRAGARCRAAAEHRAASRRPRRSGRLAADRRARGGQHDRRRASVSRQPQLHRRAAAGVRGQSSAAEAGGGGGARAGPGAPRYRRPRPPRLGCVPSGARHAGHGGVGRAHRPDSSAGRRLHRTAKPA